MATHVVVGGFFTPCLNCMFSLRVSPTFHDFAPCFCNVFVMSTTVTTVTPQALNDHHFAHLTEERGLPAEWVAVNCQSVDAQTASEHLGYTAKSGGILLIGAGSQKQFKPDKPWKSEDSGKAPKYRSCKGDGYDAMLPRHPERADYWENLEGLKGEFVLDGHPCVVLTEGFFKAIALTANGVPTVALLGVEMGLTAAKADPQGKRYLVPSLEKFAKAGFGFLIAFDADCARKKEVIAAQAKLGHHLNLFSPVYSITGLWLEEEGKGIDDYIKANGFEKFEHSVLARAETLEQWKMKHFEVLEKQFQPEKKTPPPEEVAREIAEDYKNQLAFNNEADTWMRYEAENRGVWSTESDKFVRSIIAQILTGKRVKFKSQTYVKQVVESLEVHPEIIKRKWQEVSPGEYLPYKNGLLEISTGKFVEHSPQNFLTWSLPREFDPAAKEFQKIDSWLTFASNNNPTIKNILVCYAAAVLKGKHELQKFLHLIGLGGSGKGTYARLLTDLIGQDNVCNSSVEAFCSNRFETSSAYKKRLLLFSDEIAFPRDISNLMKATGGDLLRAEQKNKPSFQYRFEGMVLMLSEHPKAQGIRGNGYKRRCIVLPMNAKVQDKDRRDLNAEFQPELGGFTNYLLGLSDEFVSATLRGVGEIPECKLSFFQARLQEDSLAAWLNDCLIKDTEAKAPVGADKDEGSRSTPETLFGSYADYCRRSGMNAKSIVRFSPELLELCSSLGWPAERVRSAQGVCITGIRLRNGATDNHLLTYEQLLTVEARRATLSPPPEPDPTPPTNPPKLDPAPPQASTPPTNPPKLDPPSGSEQQTPLPDWRPGQSVKLINPVSRFFGQTGTFKGFEWSDFWDATVAVVSGLKDDDSYYPVHNLEPCEGEVSVKVKKPSIPELAKLHPAIKDEWLWANRKTKKPVWIDSEKYIGLANVYGEPLPGDKLKEWRFSPVGRAGLVLTSSDNISVLKSELGKFKEIAPAATVEQISLELDLDNKATEVQKTRETGREVLCEGVYRSGEMVYLNFKTRKLLNSWFKYYASLLRYDHKVLEKEDYSTLRSEGYKYRIKMLVYVERPGWFDDIAAINFGLTPKEWEAAKLAAMPAPEGETPTERLARLAKAMGGLSVKDWEDYCNVFGKRKVSELTEEEATKLANKLQEQIESRDRFLKRNNLTRRLEEE